MEWYQSIATTREQMFETLSANLYTDFGDGLGKSPSGVQAISGPLALRFSSDPNEAKSMVFVYK